MAVIVKESGHPKVRAPLKLVFVWEKDAGGTSVMLRDEPFTLEDYIRRVEPIFAVEDFWERETSRQTEIVGSVAHVLSRYESLWDPNGPPFERGANSIQLFFDDSRWWVVSVMWNTSRSS